MQALASDKYCGGIKYPFHPPVASMKVFGKEIKAPEFSLLYDKDYDGRACALYNYHRKLRIFERQKSTMNLNNLNKSKQLLKF